MIGVLSVRSVSLVVVALVGLAAGTARAQSVSLENPRLNLGISAGAPGAETQVQLTLAGPPDMGLGKIEAVIIFPAGALEFQKVSGYLLDVDAVKVETKAQEPADGQQKIVVSVRSSSPDKPLPTAALVTLDFKVAKDATLGVLALALTARAFALNGQEVAPVEVLGGRINIQDPAIFYGCFFYMH